MDTEMERVSMLSLCLAENSSQLQTNHFSYNSLEACQENNFFFSMKAAGGKVEWWARKRRNPNPLYICQEKLVCYNIIKNVKHIDFQFYSMLILKMIKVKTQLTFYLLLVLYFRFVSIHISLLSFLKLINRLNDSDLPYWNVAKIKTDI